MQFSYQMPLSGSTNQLQIQTKSLWLGSCFAENIGKKLQQFQLPATINPAGIVFNPILIFKQLELALGSNINFKTYHLKHQDIWHSYLYHGEVYGFTEEELTQKINAINLKLSAAIKESNYLFLTWGNAWLFQHKEKQLDVANCHKQAQSTFSKRLVQPDEIIAAAKKTFDLIKAINPNLKIVISLSPVKYLRWGAHENNLGKSSLFLALYQLQQEYKDLVYFPAFEMMQDELRDYRFYQQDFAHPNELAIQYIWEKFRDLMFDEPTKNYLTEYAQLERKLNHKTLHPNSLAHQQFLTNLIHDLNAFKHKYPHVAF